MSADHLTADRFDGLLRALSEDARDAADRYALLSRRLEAYFRWQGCADGQHLADQVMDRLARRLAEGEAVVNITSYALGMARLVAKEAHAREMRERRVASQFVLMPSSGQADDSALTCLEGCLGRLSSDRREHLLAYYTADRSRIDERRRLAQRLGVSPLALRNRMLRLRQTLEGCVARCLSKRAER